MAEKDLVWSNMASFRYFVSQTYMRIIACHVAYLECNLYTSSCAKEKIFKDWNYSERKSFLKICNKWARIWSNVVQKLKPKAIQKVAWRKNCTRRWLHEFWRKNSRESILNLVTEMLSGETLCKFYQIFPPKVLVYIWTNFSSHFYDYLTEV